MMDMNAFDDNLKDRAGGFRIEPRKEVWERVEQELDSKKRKRRMFWFWWFAPLLLAGGAILYTQNPGEKTGNIQTGGQNEVAMVKKETPGNALQNNANRPQSEMQSVLTGIKQGNNNNKNTQHTTPFTHSSSGSGVALTARPPVDAPLRKSEPPVETTPNRGAESTGNPLPEIFENNATQKVAEKVADTLALVQTGRDSNAQFKADTVNTVAPAGTLQAPANVPAGDSATAGLQSPPVAKKESKPSKGSWMILAGAGLHNHTSKGISLEKSRAEYNGGLSNNAGGGQSGSPQVLEPPKPGPGFMLGIQRVQPFGQSKHWSWVGGAHYQYQSFKINSGSLKDSALSYTTDRGTVTASNYYRARTGVEQTGSQHRLHLLAAVQWHIDKKQRWTWQNGMFGGFVLSSDYLIPQRSPLGWLPSKDLTQKGYAGIETGFLFSPSKWGAGIFGQYNLTNSLNITGPAPQYWRGIELRIRYNLSSNTINK